MPRLASVYPVECRSMWTCTENGSPAASPARSIMRPIPIRPNGWPRSLMNTQAHPVSLLLPLQQLETVHLIALEVMDAISAALEPAHDDGPRSVASWARAICSPKQSTATKRRLCFSVWLKSKAISPERSLRENRRRYSPKPSQIGQGHRGLAAEAPEVGPWLGNWPRRAGASLHLHLLGTA
jgi:hypothetical protein